MIDLRQQIALMGDHQYGRLAMRLPERRGEVLKPSIVPEPEPTRDESFTKLNM